MFIDKPITVSEEEAIEFMQACRDNGVRITGGSCLKHAQAIQQLKQEYLNGEEKTIGGFFRAPVSLNNAHGGFFFYSQHLTEMICEVFGYYPRAVEASKKDNIIDVRFDYGDFNIVGKYIDGSYLYYASHHTMKKITSLDVAVDSTCFMAEFDEFYELLGGAEQKISYKDFIAQVFLLNAIYRSIESGKEEKVKEFSL
jgi:predicted dehydrogenase